MNDKKIDNTLLDRIFNQIDTNTGNITKLTMIAGEHSSSISILKRILLYVLLFIIVSSLSMFFINKKEIRTIKNNSASINKSVEVNKKSNDEKNN